MLVGLSMDKTNQTAHARERRRQQRRHQVRRRRLVASAVLLALAAGITLGARSVGGSHAANPAAETTPSLKAATNHVPVPQEIRGVHVTMALASLRGKLQQYLAMPGLNTLELDVKDENGKVGFVPSAVPLARRTGAVGPYYKANWAVKLAHAKGIYLIGRVVTFEDPTLSEQRPDLAIRTSDGSRWLNNAGLGWTNPYDRRVWKYNVDLAVAAAKAGFDEIQFDYVRFPSDGDISIIRYPGVRPQPMSWTIPAFVQYARKRLHPLGARVSVDVFGLAATHDLGIGQVPRRISRYVDAVYPMVYPSHYNPGEYNLSDPEAVPGQTVTHSLLDFQTALEGRKARLTPWLQDFSLGRTYSLGDVQAQVRAARSLHAHGFLLWNGEGLYDDAALLPPA
jgi:hypothetical protein